MKNKLLWGIICLIIVVIVSIFITKTLKNKEKSNNEELTQIRLAEVTHSSFYAPLYIALEKGFFQEEGLDVELILTPGADKVSAAVLSGDVEIGFAGAESAIYVYNQNEDDYLQIFAGLTKRDGQFIVSREKISNFKLDDLIGHEILTGRASGMPALNFMNALKNAGIDSNKININTSVEFSALSGSFIGGEGDFVNLFEQSVRK